MVIVISREYFLGWIKVSKTIIFETRSIERSVSAMNRIFSYARNTLSVFIGSDLMLLSMNNDLLRKIYLEKVLDNWTLSKRRIVSLK